MKPTKDGTSLKAHLEQLQKQLGRELDELKSPVDFPSGMQNVWDCFLALNDSRTMGQATANPINYGEIKDFVDLTNAVLSPRDVAVIKELDKIYLKVMNSNG